MNEIWADVVGYEGLYQVSSLGRVKSMCRFKVRCERIMTPQYHDSGHLQVHLRRPGEHRKHYVHRLVAKAFLDNPEDKDVVNHLNRDRADNRVANLEWATIGENNVYRYSQERVKEEMAF